MKTKFYFLFLLSLSLALLSCNNDLEEETYLSQNDSSEFVQENEESIISTRASSDLLFAKVKVELFHAGREVKVQNNGVPTPGLDYNAVYGAVVYTMTATVKNIPSGYSVSVSPVVVGTPYFIVHGLNYAIWMPPHYEYIVQRPYYKVTYDGNTARIRAYEYDLRKNHSTGKWGHMWVGSNHWIDAKKDAYFAYRLVKSS